MSEQFIGNYRVVSLVGRGGMGSVYLAVHKDVPNLRVILKILSDPRLADRFTQEADKLALLDGHPNICQIKHFFNHEGDLVIAMEYIDGVTLDEKLKTEGRMPIAEGVRIVSDMLAILAYAHQRGISHRDIKPSNVMIDKSGQVKIIDFGIAKGKTDPNLTTTGASLGTPNYMAPEQFIPQADTDYALADLYACATTLYLMLTGELPFKGENEFLLRDAKLAGKVPSARALNPGISKELEKIIFRALEKEPSKRFASAEEMRKALQVTLREEKLQADQPTHAMQTGSDTGKAGPKPKRGKSRKPLIMGVLGAVVVVAAVGVWLMGGLPKTGGANVPELLAPLDGAVVKNDQPIVLRWTPTLSGGGVYKVEYTADSSFVSPRQMRTEADSAVFPPGVPAGSYRWRVTVLNEQGVAGEPSAERLLTVAGAVAAQGTLIVAVAPSGDVYLNDRSVGRGQAEVRVTVDTGLYDVRVENDRSTERVFRDTVRVTADGLARRVFAFTVPASGKPATTSTTKPAVKPVEVRVGSRPRGAAIFVDGERQAEHTNNTLWLLPGRHVVEVMLTIEGQEQRRADTLEVAADSVHKVLFDFEQ